MLWKRSMKLGFDDSDTDLVVIVGRRIENILLYTGPVSKPVGGIVVDIQE
jgi:hypothetical protein